MKNLISKTLFVALIISSCSEGDPEPSTTKPDCNKLLAAREQAEAAYKYVSNSANGFPDEEKTEARNIYIQAQVAYNEHCK